jgi:hypothetical protein
VYCACTVRLLYCNTYGNTSGSTSFLTTLVVALQLEYSLSTKYVYSRTFVQRYALRVLYNVVQYVYVYSCTSLLVTYGSTEVYFRTFVRKYENIFVFIYKFVHAGHVDMSSKPRLSCFTVTIFLDIFLGSPTVALLRGPS